jgi:hypothetical protein
VTLRRTYLSTGVFPHISTEDVGRERCELVVHGWTRSGAEHEVRLEVGSFALASLVENIRDHFVKLAANEAAARMNRERALRMPAAGGGA